jgi:cell growth-regulating nucleolar protein
MDDADTPMLEAPSSVLNHPGTPMLSHSGLTGGLDRMLRSPSSDDEDSSNNPRRRYQDPSSPLKRTRRDEKEAHGDAGLGISIKNRAERLVSSMFAGSSISGSSAAGNEPEARKSKKAHKIRNAPNDEEVSSDALKTKRKISAQIDGDRPSRRLKKVDHPERSYSPRNEDGREVVVYRQENNPDEVQRQMAAHFLSLVTKGPESSRGFSMNKVLKRFHKDFTDEFDGDRGRGQGRSRADRERRGDDEKDLWRTLRLKQNERGEIVLFF